MRGRRNPGFVLLVLLLRACTVWARTFYVDPSPGCSDDAVGTSTAAPWCTPPGTLDATGAAFLSGGSWGTAATTPSGAITTSNRVACGDTILLKGGSTQDSSEGGTWCLVGSATSASTAAGGCYKAVGGVYYTTCSAANRITIRVATGAEWSGSSGHFIKQNANTTPGWVRYTSPNGGLAGYIDVHRADGLVLGGNGATQQLEVVGGTAQLGARCDAILIEGSDTPDAAMTSDVRLQWVYVHGSSHGIRQNGVRNSLLIDTLVEDTDHACYTWGVTQTSLVKNTGVIRATARRCASVEAGGNNDGFNGFTGEHIWLIDSRAEDNYERGIDFGEQGWASNGPIITHSRNVVAINNGRACSTFGNAAAANCTGAGQPHQCCTGVGTGPTCRNCAGSGIDNSGGRGSCINDPETNPVTHYFMGATVYKNSFFGIGVYGGGRMEFWNGTLFGNGWNRADQEEIAYDRNGQQINVFNTALVTRPYGKQPWKSENSNDVCANNKPSSKNSAYFYHSTQAQAFSDFLFSGSTYQASSTSFATALANAGFLDPTTDRVQSTATPWNLRLATMTGTCDQTPPATGFDGASVYSTCDFRPCTGAGQPVGACAGASDLIDAGRCYLLTSGAGTNATTLGVQANGGSSDPRNYFIQPSSFLDAVGDTIRVGAATATISSMDASHIVVTSPISWNNGDCVHLPYNGSAPDMGAFESGGVATTTTTSTTLATTTTTTTSTTLATTTTTSTSTTTTLPAGTGSRGRWKHRGVHMR